MAERNSQSDASADAVNEPWSVFFARESPKLTRFVTGVLRDADAARDVAQIAFARLLERQDEVDPAARRAWLYRVALREALNQRRKAERGKRARERLFWLRATDGEGASVGDRAEREEERERVRQALEELPEAQRKVVEMRIYEGQTFAQIAEALNIPLGTALTRMRAALGRLRKTLGDDGETKTD